MDENRKIRVAITHGDTNGIGYETIFKAFSEPDMLDICTPIIYGSPKAAAYHRKALDMEANFTIINSAAEAHEGKLNILPTFDEEVKIDLGQPTPESGTAAMKALDKAMTDLKDNMFDCLVCCPSDKTNMQLEGYQFPGLPAYIDTCIGDGRHCLPILINNLLRVALLTDEVSLKDVAAKVTTDNVVNRCRIFSETLRRDFRVSAPRIAILALNPAGSTSAQGQEEQETILPAIELLGDEGILAFGPYQADEFFGSGYWNEFDGVLAMYHDQGMAPFRALSDDCSIAMFAGLNTVITAPDETPEFDIAGKGQADPQALRYAIYTAIDSVRNRLFYDEPLANPLPKLYHEKRDDSDKARFNVPRKRQIPPKKQAEQQAETPNNG